MTDKQIEEMVLDIVEEIDHDIFKLGYNKETAECPPKEVEGNVAALVKIVRRHLSWLDDVSIDDEKGGISSRSS